MNIQFVLNKLRLGSIGLLLAALSTVSSAAQPDSLRLLVVGDPFAMALQEAELDIERLYGMPLMTEIVGYNDMRAQTLLNAQDERSQYDIVSVDVLWMGDYAAQNILLPLDDRIAQTPSLEIDDFLPTAYAASAIEGVQYGLPVQPHPELLWIRADWFAAAGLAPPTTTEDVLQAAEALHDPDAGRYGICWNAQRRQALGQQMAHFYGAFGQPLLQDDQPTLDTPAGQAAAHYALALMAYSPPDILTMAWDQRILRFDAGGCVMTYGWGARTFLAEEVSPLVAYLPAPHAPGANPVTPVGTWSLGIPANIGPRADLAWDFLAWLSSPAQQHLLAEHGNGGMPRQSLLQDPNLIDHYPAFPLVAELAEAGTLADWMRAPVGEWAQLEIILGTVFHDMLRGLCSPEAATAEAQRQANDLFKAFPSF